MHSLSLRSKIILLSVLSVLFILIYQFIFIDMKFFDYAMYIRTPKLLAIIIAAFCIGYASMIFQSIINNRIVTPCLLGMNSLYIVIHTSIVFFLGGTSIFATNNKIAFVTDVILMGILATTIYGFLFKKTKHNMLYILLSGSVLATFFTSVSNTMVRVMDPNEYDTMLSDLVAGFDHVNAELLTMAVALVIITIVLFYKEIKLLDIISLGKNQAINLGVNYDATITKLLIGVTFLITIATALVGPISFLGLIIANLSRELFKTYKHSYLMLGSFLMGIIVLLLGQILIEHVFGFSTQISVFINLFGGAYFLYLIFKNKGLN
ncbi:CRISPR-associated protein Cas5 [Epulopiscium sp. SCG-B10WGA-EpuloA2]|nr:CRISPR-associated protein Cas5 [Epulopiscium sp. SCG-B10WGA-EpuloA2]